MIAIDFRQKCSYYVPAVFGLAKGRSDGAFELGRSIFEIVYLSEKGPACTQLADQARSHPKIDR